MTIFQQFIEQRSRAIVITLALLLCAIFILQTLRLWGGYGVGQDSGLASAEQVRSFDNQAARDFDTAKIIDRNLFPAVAMVSRPATAIAASMSNLKLEAIFESEERGQSKAIVSNGEHGSKTLAEGAEIAPGIQLDRIERDHLLINNNGRQEALRFPEPSQEPANLNSSINNYASAGTDSGSPAMLNESGGAPAMQTSAQENANNHDGGPLSEAEYQQLIAELPAEEQQRIQGGSSDRDLGKLISSVSENEKIKLVTQRLEQLRRNSRNR